VDQYHKLKNPKRKLSKITPKIAHSLCFSQRLYYQCNIHMKIYDGGDSQKIWRRNSSVFR
jgi:hypothetical protein